MAERAGGCLRGPNAPVFLCSSSQFTSPFSSSRQFDPSAKAILPFHRKLLILSICIGLNNFLISWGISYLSVSTSSLHLSCQLGCNLILSAILMKQKLTFSNVDCVILLTLGSVLLAIGSNHDRPKGVTKAQFFFGFVSILEAALLFALYLPVMELMYRKVSTYGMVIEMQVLMEFTAMAFSLVGMVAAAEFDATRKESLESFDLGNVGRESLAGGRRR